MAEYAKLRPEFWVRGTGRRLRGDPTTQVLATYLMSCPARHMTGLYYLALPTLVHETGLDEYDVLRGLERLHDEGFAHLDRDAEIAWVPAMAREQVGLAVKTADRRHKHISDWVSEFKSHPFYDHFLARYRDNYELHSHDFNPENLRPIPPFKGPSGNGGRSYQGPSNGDSPPHERGNGNPFEANSGSGAIQEQQQEHAREREGDAAATRSREGDPWSVGAATMSRRWHRFGKHIVPGGVAHGLRHWGDDYESIALELGQADAPDIAADALFAYFWLAPNGPIAGGRIKPARATPEHLAKRITADLDAAHEWWTASGGEALSAQWLAAHEPPQERAG